MRCLGEGRFRLDETLAGDLGWGLHRGVELEGGAPVYLSTTTMHEEPLEQLARRFAGRALCVGREVVDGLDVDVLVERQPAGRVSTLRSYTPVESARLLSLAARAVHGAAVDDEVFGSLRPELFFVDDGASLTGVAPWSELFWRGRAAQSQGRVYPFAEPYLAPELVRVEPFDRAADVFCLAACYLRWRLGRYPIAGSTWLERVMALAEGRFVDEVQSLELPVLVRAALSSDPRARPSLVELEGL